MDIQSFMSAVSSVGFPIVCCFAMFYFINKELKALREAIAANTAATIELSTIVKLIKGDDEK